MSNFYASYFAGCILIPKDELIEKTEEFFDEPDFNSQKFDELIAHFTNSPETFYYRLTNLLSAEFGIKIYFICVLSKKKHRQGSNSQGITPKSTTSSTRKCD